MLYTKNDCEQLIKGFCLSFVSHDSQLDIDCIA